MPRAKKRLDPIWRRGWKAGRQDAWDKLPAIVQAIEDDINKMSGISVMLWNDREKRQEIIDRWITLAEEVIER